MPAILTDPETAKLFTERFAKDKGNWFERLLDSVEKYLKKAYDVLRGQKSWEQMDAVKGNIDALADIREAYFIALEAAKESGKVENEGVPFSKKDAGGGKQYVEADRDVIKGDDPSKWGAQVTNFINREIRQGRDVTVYGIDGDALTITRDTAGKAQFRNKVKLPNGNYRLMTDSEYAVKLRAETHIDEVAEVSKRGAATVPDYSGHSFAKDGFNYRTAYFMDSTGYYKLTLSVGKNGSINTIYNVGKIEEAKFPRHFVAQRPERNLTSIDNVSQPDTTVNTSIRENSDNDTVSAEKKYSAKDSDYLSAVERGDTGTAQQMVDEAAKAAGYTIKAYHGTASDFTVFDKGKVGNDDIRFSAKDTNTVEMLTKGVERLRMAMGDNEPN